MSLLYPIYLLGALAIALPVYLHLKRKPPKESQPVSSLMFWRANETLSPRRTAKLEDWLLLALRSLAILLLVLVFARPYLNDESKLALGQGIGSRYAFVIDTSASMQRKNAWDQALKRVEKHIDKLKPKDEIAIYRFDQQVNAVISFSEWKALSPDQRRPWLKQQLSELKPGWGSTRIDFALIRAVEAIQEIATVSSDPVAGAEIILVTDLQKGSEWDRLTSLDWPEDIKLSIERIDADFKNNAALGTVASANPSEPKVRITNHPANTNGSFKLTWTTANLYESQYIAPGQSTVVSAPQGFVSGSSLQLSGDLIEFDNTVFFPPPEPAKPTLALWSDSLVENKSSLAFYLDQAMISTHRMEPTLTRDRSESADFYLVDGSINAADAEQLRKEIDRGKSCLFIVDRPEAASALAKLLADDSVTVTPAVMTQTYTLFEKIDFQHPVLKPFAAIETRDFSNIRIWNYQQVTAKEIQSLIDFEDGSPALFEAPSGKGKIFGLTTSWDSEGSQLARSTKFVPLLYSLLDYSGIRAGASESFTVGDRLPIHRDFKTDQPIQLKGVSEPVDSQSPFFATRPGIFEFSQGDRKRTYVANLDPQESQLEPMSLDTFARFGIGIDKPNAKTDQPDEARKTSLTSVELENRQKWFRWVACLVFLFLIIETFLGGNRRSASTQNQPEPLTSSAT